jgi:amino acid transporter
VSATGLRRAISGRMLVVLVVGDVLGAGIYALVGAVATQTGGAIWTAFALALGLALLTACSYAELVTKYPRAAGAALYVNRAFDRPFLSFLVTFAVMCSGVTSAATLSRAFGGTYLGAFVDVPVEAAAVVFIGVVALVNAHGIAGSVRTNLVLTAIELGGLLLVCVIAAGVLADGGGGADAGRALELRDGVSAFSAITGGAAIAFYALVGFEDSVNLAEETRDPRRSYPRALFGGLLAAGAVYVVVTVLASMAVPTARLAGSDAALLEVATAGPLGVDAKVFSAIALFALANGALINMLMASRLLYGMSREGILPAALGRVDAGRGTPGVAIAFTTALAAILILTGDLAELADLTVFLLLAVFAVVNVSVLVLRREPAGHDHFRAPSLAPVLGIGVSLWLMVFKTEEAVAARSLALLGVGALLAVLTRRRSPRRRFR